MHRLFDYLYQPDDDIWMWRLATAAAGCAALLGLTLMARADPSLGGMASGAGGAVLFVGSLLGFRHYWRNL